MNRCDDWLEEERVSSANRLKRIEALRETIAIAEVAVKRFPAAKIANTRHYSGRVVISLQVDTFADAAPLIEYLQAWALPVFNGEGYSPAALDCSESKDWAQFAQREYLFEGLMIECTPRAGAENCRAVVVGYADPEPIYKFECDGEVSL